MKTHYAEKNFPSTACGQRAKERKTSEDIEDVSCSSCLKIIRKPHKPVKCWIEIKGTDQKWKIDAKDSTVDELITYLAGRFSDKIILEEMKKRKLTMETTCSCGGELVGTKVCGVCAHSYCQKCLEEDFDICQGCLSKGMKLNFCEDKNGKKFYPGKWLKSEHSNTWVQVLQIGKHCIVSTAGNVNRVDFVEAGWIVHERVTPYKMNKNFECFDKCKFTDYYIGSMGCDNCKQNSVNDPDQKWVICKLYNEDKKDGI